MNSGRITFSLVQQPILDFLSQKGEIEYFPLGEIEYSLPRENRILFPKGK
jgi:hypothetical protein